MKLNQHGATSIPQLHRVTLKAIVHYPWVGKNLMVLYNISATIMMVIAREWGAS